MAERLGLSRGHRRAAAIALPLLLLFLLFLCCTTSSARAAPAESGGNIGRFHATPGVEGLFGMDGAGTRAPGPLAMGLVFDHAAHPLLWRYADGTYDPVLNSRFSAQLAARMGLMRSLDVGVVLPILLHQGGPPSRELGDLSGQGLGDLRIIGRVELLPARIFGFGLGLSGTFTAPTGDRSLLHGGSGMSFLPRATAELRTGPLRLLASIAYNMRPNHQILGLRLDDEVLAQAGGEMKLDTLGLPVSALLETHISTAAARPFSSGDVNAAETIVGLRARLSGAWVARAGVGVGLAAGLGTPAYRLLAGLAYSPESLDSDGDGLPDSADDCPEDPEDYDAYADLDGCPEEGGTSAIPRRGGHSTTEPQDRDGDGLPNSKDLCPDSPEDLDGHEDQDGCPEIDNDRDGVRDEKDQCPQEPETINGIDDYDGCPDFGEPFTFVEPQRIEIIETINFETSRAVIKSESKLLLDQVALQLLAHDEIRLVRIEGHTDSVGDAEVNLRLSQDRADAVRDYLIERGVAGERLEAEGFGEAHPLSNNDTPRGRAMNRRVEFLIVEQDPR